jgi:hypothetical protein
VGEGAVAQLGEVLEHLLVGIGLAGLALALTGTLSIGHGTCGAAKYLAGRPGRG